MRDKSDAPDIRVAVFARKPQTFGEICPHHITVERFNVEAGRSQPRFDDAGDSCFAGAGQTRKPNHKAFVNDRHAMNFSPGTPTASSRSVIALMQRV
jgi:hypothetical protein